jgi:hypothetical protein
LRRCVAYLHTPQICGICRGVKVGIHGLLNWTAENFHLGIKAPSAALLWFTHSVIGGQQIIGLLNLAYGSGPSWTMDNCKGSH